MKHGSDIEGLERWVVGFSKTADEFGDHLMQVEYKLNGITLTRLREIFNINASNHDYAILDMIDPLEINEEQAKLLNPYIADGKIDLNKYNFELYCYQAPGYDWSDGCAKPIK